MSAATEDRYGERQPSELVPYTGVSGYTYYKNTMTMKSGDNIILPVSTTGMSNSVFLGVNSNKINLSAGLGASAGIINIWKTGEFTFAAQGTGASADIGKRAYATDNQTVGNSAAAPALTVGEIVGVPTTSTYRIRIDNAISLPVNAHGVSWAPTQN